MPDAIDGARRLLQDRIAEIDSEAARLRAAVESLGGKVVKAKSRPRSTSKRRRPNQTSKRAPRGQRREQFLAAVKAKPKSKVAEIAKEIGVSANQAHGLVRQLLKEGAVSKRAGKISIAKKPK